MERTRQEAAVFLRRHRHSLGLRLSGSHTWDGERTNTYQAMGFIFTNGQRKTPLLDIVIND